MALFCYQIASAQFFVCLMQSPKKTGDEVFRRMRCLLARTGPCVHLVRLDGAQIHNMRHDEDSRQYGVSQRVQGRHRSLYPRLSRAEGFGHEMLRL